MFNIKGKSFVKLLDYSKEEIQFLLSLSKNLKNQKYNGVVNKPLNGKSVVLLFQKDSTRTRCAFEVGAADLGMKTVYLGPTGSQFGKKESVEDSAKVLGRMFDGIQFRGYKQTDVELLAKHSGVPV
jgi:ornithine carbamoyltransferase